MSEKEYPEDCKDEDYILPYTRTLIKGSSSLAKLILSDPGSIKEMGESGSEEKYTRPPRRYELPEFREGMEFPKSAQKYLRPTKYCDPREPEVVAMANELGALEKPEKEFAKSAFNFTKGKLTLEILPMDDVSKTLERGTGSCLHKISTFLALCRSAGIKSRYKLYSPRMVETWEETFLVDPMLREWYDTMGYFILHGEGEVYLDDEWVIGDVGPTPERQAASGVPITKLGEGSSALSPEPGSLMYTESLPRGVEGMLKTAKRIAPSTIDKVNYNIIKKIEEGKKILEELGGKEAYNKQIKKKRITGMSKIDIEDKEEIGFGP